MAARKRKSRKARTSTGRFKKGWTITRAGRGVKCRKGAAGKRSACYRDGTGRKAAASKRARTRRRAVRAVGKYSAAFPKTRTWGYMLAAKRRKRRRKGRR